MESTGQRKRADEFEIVSLEQKKMIICQMFKHIEASRDYKISVEMNMTYRQFCGGVVYRRTGSNIVSIR